MKIIKSSARKPPTQAPIEHPSDLKLFELAKAVLDAKKEYAIVREQEQSKRLAIASDLQKHVASISATKEILERHLANEYSLRKETISEILSRLDHAIENNQETTAAAALGAIRGIVATNPLNGIAEVCRVLESDNGTLEI